MGRGRSEAFEQACDEHERLTRAREAARQAQEDRLEELLREDVAPRLEAIAGELPIAIDGVRPRGIALVLGDAPASAFVVVDDESGFAIVERAPHVVRAVPKRVTIGALVERFGRQAAAIVMSAVERAERTRPAASHRVSATPSPSEPKRARTRACPACDAKPTEKNYAKHLRTIHGLGPDGEPLKARPPAGSPRHQVCRMCGARLPAGRLDAHLTAMHGVFHVHPAGARTPEGRREAARALTQRQASRDDARGPVKAPRGGRDFLAEARHERTLVARADSPHRNRDREGRFSDAPDVERMDGDSHA